MLKLFFFCPPCAIVAFPFWLVLLVGAKVYPPLEVLLAAGAAVLSTIAPTVSVAATGDETLVLRMRQKAAQITAARSS